MGLSEAWGGGEGSEQVPWGLRLEEEVGLPRGVIGQRVARQGPLVLRHQGKGLGVLGRRC